MPPKTYYNERDPYAAEWIRNLISAGHVSPGDVDERDIRDVRPDDIRGYTRCHFFAGLAGWEQALMLAGWPDDRPVWTGSCPCQPFSSAGSRAGFDDDRHLWPAWFNLIRECGPPEVFGEQVEAAIRLGWLDAVFADLEAEGYACGAAVLGAHSVGAPHIRLRTWFVANASGQRRDRKPSQLRQPSEGGWVTLDRPEASRGCSTGGLGDADCRQHGGLRKGAGWLHQPGRTSARTPGQSVAPASHVGFWADADWLPCRDGKARPVEPGTFPLAHGASARVGRLRAYGNAIVPQVAASFIEAVMGCV